MFQHFFPAFYRGELCAHLYCIPAWNACISTIAYPWWCAHFYCIPARCVRAAVLHSSTECVHFHSRVPPLVRAFLLYSSTVYVHFYFLIQFQYFFCVHFFCVPVVSACISIVFSILGCLGCFGVLWTALGCSAFWEAFWTALDCFWAARRSGKLSGLL